MPNSANKPVLGILTSGGDCPGLNAVIRGSVKCAEQLGYDVVGFHRGYEGLVPERLGDPLEIQPLDSQVVSGILGVGGTILGSTNKGRFCALKDDSIRVELDAHLLEEVKRTVQRLNLRGLICVGGDGSLAVAQQFHEAGIPVVGVPKTIDNDLSATAFTFGFDSAVACATDALDRLHTTAASHQRVMILEVMGRHAGWIALHAGIAGGADVILLPELPWTMASVCSHIEKRRQNGKRFSIIVVAEGAHLPDGQIVTQERRREDRQTRLGGIGQVVATEIAQRTGAETRATVLGHLQRGGGPTAFDRLLASQFGVHAVRLLHEQQYGRMVCYVPPEIADVGIMDAVGRLNVVQPSSAAVETARGLGISFGDCVTAKDLFRAPLPSPDLMPDCNLNWSPSVQWVGGLTS